MEVDKAGIEHETKDSMPYLDTSVALVAHFLLSSQLIHNP